MRISYNLQTEWLVQVDPRCYSYLTPLSWTDLKLMRTSLDHFAPTNGKLNLTLYYFTISIIFFFIPFWIARINFGLCYSTCHLQLLFFSLFFLLLQQLPILHDFAFHGPSISLNHIALQRRILSLACLLVGRLYFNRMVGTLDALLCMSKAHNDVALVRLRRPK